MEGHEGACLVVKEDGQTEIDMKKTYQSIEGHVVLWGHGDTCLVKSLERVLTMEFSRVNHHHRSVIKWVGKGLKQPRRASFSGWNILRGYPRCSLHETSPTGRTPPRLFQDTLMVLSLRG